jgi:hypothetical protein
MRFGGTLVIDDLVVSDDNEPFGVVLGITDGGPDFLQSLGAAQLPGAATHPLALRRGGAPAEALGRSRRDVVWSGNLWSGNLWSGNLWLGWRLGGAADDEYDER